MHSQKKNTTPRETARMAEFSSLRLRGYCRLTLQCLYSLPPLSYGLCLCLPVGEGNGPIGSRLSSQRERESKGDRTASKERERQAGEQRRTSQAETNSFQDGCSSSLPPSSLLSSSPFTTNHHCSTVKCQTIRPCN